MTSSPNKRAKIEQHEFNVIITVKGSAAGDRASNFNFKALSDAICCGRRVTSRKFTLDAEITLADGTVKSLKGIVYKLRTVTRDAGVFGVTYGSGDDSDDVVREFSLVQIVDNKKTDNSIELQHDDGHYMLYEKGTMVFSPDAGDSGEVGVKEFSFKVVSEHGAPFTFAPPAERLAERIRAAGIDPTGNPLVALQAAQDSRTAVAAASGSFGSPRA